MYYIKNYETRQAAISATDIIAPNVTNCVESNQLLIGGGDLPVDSSMSIVADGADKIKYAETKHYFKIKYSTSGGDVIANMQMDPEMTFAQWVAKSEYNIASAVGEATPAVVTGANTIKWPDSTHLLYNTAAMDDYAYADDPIVEDKIYIKCPQWT